MRIFEERRCVAAGGFIRTTLFITYGEVVYKSHPAPILRAVEELGGTAWLFRRRRVGSPRLPRDDGVMGRVNLLMYRGNSDKWDMEAFCIAASSLRDMSNLFCFCDT